MTRPGFDRKTIGISLADILPTRIVPPNIKRSKKFKTILASVREVGIIEPLAVYPDRTPNGSTKYLLLDGHLRLEALRALDAQRAVCLVSTEDEGYTYNRQINRVSAVQEHRMIIQAIQRNVPPERIAMALDVNVQRIRNRQKLLDGISPETVELLSDKLLAAGVFSILRKMKPLRQIEAAEIMISANRYTLPYAKMLLSTTRNDLLVQPKKRRTNESSPEAIARIEREMEKLYEDYKSVQDTLGETMLVLVVAKGYIGRLLRNESVAKYLQKHYRELADELSKIMEDIGADVRTVERE